MRRNESGVMKLLLLSDVEDAYLYDFYSPDKLKDVDVMISCGT